MPNERLTGKQSYIIINGTYIPITKYTPKINRKLADITDNGDYDSNTDLIYPAQLPVSATTELSVEGRFRLSLTPIAIMGILYTGISAVPVKLGLDAGHMFGSGNFDISDFQADVPVDDTVTFTCTLQSNGKFSPNV